MASTYSPLLRYELIGAGEQAGIWGNTTNVNIGSLIEQSIAGVTTIDATSLGGTTYTLSVLNGAPDEARSMVLSFVGVATSAFTVIVPTSQKLYVVRNATGQTINFRTLSQVTPQPVDNANSTLIFCDGLNVLPGIAAPSVGTLLVSGGGTGVTSFGGGFVKSPGGSSALTSSSTVNAATELSGIVSPTNGGTGINAPTAGRLLIGNGTSAMTQLAGTSTNNFLSWNGTTWTEASSLGPTKGGTGLTSYATGQIIYASATNTLATLNPGLAGQVLTMSGGLPVWQTPTTGAVTSVTATSPLSSSGGATPNISLNASGVIATTYTNPTITVDVFGRITAATSGSGGTGTVTSVGLSGGTTGLSVSNSPITTSGTMTLGGTLSVSNGGTGASSLSGAASNGFEITSVSQIITANKFYNGGSSGGKLRVGATSDPTPFWNAYFTNQATHPAIVANGVGANCTAIGVVRDSTTGTMVEFAFGTLASYAVVGAISTNGSTVTYGTSSDYRLKTDVQPLVNATPLFMQLQPVTYIWKNNPSLGRVQGFIADQVQQVVPEAVSGEKDAVFPDGTIDPQQLDTSMLVSLITAALKETVNKVTALEARIAALEAR